MYFYDNRIVEYTKNWIFLLEANLKLLYTSRGWQPECVLFGYGVAWLVRGTHELLINMTNFVKIV